jgi:HD-like signal output (HDOD) protein
MAEAIFRIGAGEIYRAVLKIVASAGLKSADAFGMMRIDLWRHSLAVGVASQILAARLREEPSETCFTAGLLHDVGKVLLARAAPGIYQTLLKSCETSETGRKKKATIRPRRISSTDRPDTAMC